MYLPCLDTKKARGYFTNYYEATIFEARTVEF